MSAYVVGRKEPDNDHERLAHSGQCQNICPHFSCPNFATYLPAWIIIECCLR